MIVLDAYALVAFIAREPAGAEVRDLLRAGPAVISAINLAETIDRFTRVDRVSEQKIRRILEPMIGRGHLLVAVADAETAWRASAIRTSHYRRRTSELSLADCFLLASTKPGEDAIATSDPPVAAAARALGIELVALPDSGGRRP